MEKQLTEKESLALITNMLLRTKMNIRKGAYYFLFWGWLVFTAAILEYFLINLAFQHHYVVWIGVGVIGGAFAIFNSKRKNGSSAAITFAGKILQYVWISFVVLLIIMLFLSQVIEWSVVYAALIALYGTGTFISGGILKFRPLIVGGIFSWVISIVCIFSPFLIGNFQNMLLMLCLSLVVSYIIPGHILQNSKDDI